MKNILITSAGRRVELVEKFQYSSQSSVYCTDLNPLLSAACQIADKCFKVPKVTDSRYSDFLLELCINNDIGLIVPTIDTELYLLSLNREKYSDFGVSICVSDSSFIGACRDKRLTAKLFESIGIPTPKIYQHDEFVFPIFCKPYDGSCSIGAQKLSSKNELTADLLANRKNIFMEFIDSEFHEYTCDAYFDNSSKLKCLVPRERLETRAGEVSKGVTRRNFVYDFLIEKLAYLHGARGCITIQVFGNPKSLEIKGLEINPRFGGGYPLTTAAGAKYEQWLIQEYIHNKSVDFFENWTSNLCMLRYDAKVLVSLD